MRPALKILLVITIFAPTGCDWNSDSERDKTATASIEVLLDQRRRARADICVKEITELLRKMSARGGQTPLRMRDVVVNSFELIELARFTPNAEQSAEFKSELVGLLPGYQSLIEKMAIKSSTLKEFENQFGGDGKMLAWIIASIRGITLDDYQVELSNIVTPSLTACPICEGMVSIEAHACPHCGLPLPVAEVEPPNTEQSLQFLKSQGLTGMRGADAETLYKGDKSEEDAMTRLRYLAGTQSTQDVERLRELAKRGPAEKKGTLGAKAADIFDSGNTKTYKDRIDAAINPGTGGNAQLEQIMNDLQVELHDQFGDSLTADERESTSREMYKALKEGGGEDEFDAIMRKTSQKNAQDYLKAKEEHAKLVEHMQALGFTSDEIKHFQNNATSFEEMQEAAAAID